MLYVHSDLLTSVHNMCFMCGCLSSRCCMVFDPAAIIVVFLMLGPTRHSPTRCEIRAIHDPAVSGFLLAQKELQNCQTY